MPNLRPLVEELSPAPSVMDALAALAERPGVVLFDSALRGGERGRYSFLTADPQHTWVLDRVTFGTDPFGELRAALDGQRAETVAGLPPFQGGIAGLLSYELGGCWERLPRAAVDDFSIPALCAGLYDWVLAWDHAQDRCWIIVQPCASQPARRLTDVRQSLQTPLAVSHANQAFAALRPLTIGTPQRPLSSATPAIGSNFAR
jgi:para-aminobenzoate synthetase component 1